MLKEIKENVNKWKNILCSSIRRLNIIKMAILPKLTYRINPIPMKILAGFWQKLTSLSENSWKCKEPRIVKIILKNKSKDGILILSIFKTY